MGKCHLSVHLLSTLFMNELIPPPIDSNSLPIRFYPAMLVVCIGRFQRAGTIVYQAYGYNKNKKSRGPKAQFRSRERER